jgi:hypothetical protein
MVEKNICQNPTCCEKRNKDQWNKKVNRYQSRKAYFKPEHKTHYGYSDRILEYFCTTSCANQWLRDNLENIVERQHVPKKITEKIIGQ